MQEDRGFLTVLVIQKSVARGHCQARVFTDRRQLYDLHFKTQVSCQAFHYCDLLGVFLSKIGEIRTDGVEQNGNDRRNTSKMPRTRTTFETFAEILDINICRELFRIDLI